MREPEHKYADMFDKTCVWQHNGVIIPELSKEEREYFSDLLETKGYVYLNEVLRAKNEFETYEGQYVGWVLPLINNETSLESIIREPEKVFPKTRYSIWDNNSYELWLDDFE